MPLLQLEGRAVRVRPPETRSRWERRGPQTAVCRASYAMEGFSPVRVCSTLSTGRWRNLEESTAFAGSDALFSLRARLFTARARGRTAGAYRKQQQPENPYNR